jgi:hypothetical protein
VIEKIVAGSGLIARLVSRSQSLQTIMTWTAIGILTLATAACSLTQERESSSPVASVDRTPASAIETAFASLRASSTENAAMDQPKAQGSCDDLEFAFLNRTCSKRHSMHAGRRHHRVATFVIGHHNAISSSVISPVASATVSEGLVPSSMVGVSVAQRRGADSVINNSSSSDVPGASQALKANQHKVRSGKRDNPKIACAQAWPYYDERCLLKQARDHARIVRVIALDRPPSGTTY